MLSDLVLAANILKQMFGTKNLVGVPYAPYLARQFSKLHRHLHFQARELKFGTNTVP